MKAGAMFLITEPQVHPMVVVRVLGQDDPSLKSSANAIRALM